MLARHFHNYWRLCETQTRLLLSPQFFLFLQDFLICQHNLLCGVCNRFVGARPGSTPDAHGSRSIKPDPEDQQRMDADAVIQ